MKYRKLDSDGDYILGRRSSQVLQDIDAVKQAIFTRLWLWQEEWWENKELGLPMLQRILGYRLTCKAADLLLRERVLGTTGVTGIAAFDSTMNDDTRAYTFTITVNTVYGQTTISEVIS